MQKGKGSTASPPAGVNQGRPQQPLQRGPTPPQQRPEDYQQRPPQGFPPQNQMSQNIIFQHPGMPQGAQIQGQQPRMPGVQPYQGAYAGRQTRPMRIPHQQQGGQPMYSSPPTVPQQVIINAPPFMQAQQPQYVSPGQMDYTQMQVANAQMQFRPPSQQMPGGYVQQVSYPQPVSYPQGPSSMQQQQMYPPQLYVVRPPGMMPVSTPMPGTPQFQPVRPEPARSAQRERKIIQIRDPNQDNKDITQEILSRHTGSTVSGGTPSSTGSPSTTPNASGQSSSSNTPPINSNQHAEQTHTSIGAQFAAQVAATLSNERTPPPPEKLKTSPQASKSTSPKISSQASGIKLISIEKATRTPEVAKPVKIAEPTKPKAPSLPASEEPLSVDGAKVSVLKPTPSKPAAPAETAPVSSDLVNTDIKESATVTSDLVNTDVKKPATITSDLVKTDVKKPATITSDLVKTDVKESATVAIDLVKTDVKEVASKPVEVPSLATQAERQVDRVQNGSASPAPVTEEVIVPETQQTEMLPPEKVTESAEIKPVKDSNVLESTPAENPTEIAEAPKPARPTKAPEPLPAKAVEKVENAVNEEAVNGIEPEPAKLKPTLQGMSVDQSVKDAPKKKKQKQRLKEMEKRSEKADLMDAYTERPMKDEAPEESKQEGDEEVKESPTEERIPSEEETWEDKDAKMDEGIIFPDAETKDGKLIYDRDFLLQFQFNPLCTEKPEGLPDIEVVLGSIQTRGPMKPPFNANRMGGGGVDFMPSYLRPARGPPNQANMARGNKGRPQPKKIVHTIQHNVELKRSENRWKRPTEKAKELPEEELKTDEVMRKFRGILNKLTPQKFQTLTQQVLDLEIDNAARLEGIIDIIFEKAISEPGFSVAYANMCRCLLPIQVTVKNAEGKESILLFRKILLNKCQKEFEKEKTDENKIHQQIEDLASEKLPENEYKLKKAELEAEEMAGRRRTLGNIRFIGELFKLKMLTEPIMHACVVKLLKSHDEESFECLCKLLSTVGKDLDHPKAKPRMDQYFVQIGKIIDLKKTSSRVRFMLQDCRDLRLNNWVPRRDDNNPKTIDQIHKEAADEEKKTQILLQQQPRQQKKDNRGRDSPRTVMPQADDNWTTVPGRGPRNVSVDPKKFQNVQKRTDTESISLGPGGRGFSAWARGSSGGTGPSSAAPSPAQQTEEPRGNRFSALGGEARRGPGAARQGSGAGRQDTRNPAAPGRWAPPTERERALEAARNIGQPKPQEVPMPDSERAPSPAPEAAEAAPEPVQEKPAPSNKELTEDEVQNKMVAIIDEYHMINDLKEATLCVQEMKSPSMHPKVVSFALNHSMEKKSSDRLATGRFMKALLKDEIISTESVLKGLDDVFEFAEDIEIDIPHVWKYIGELVGPVTCGGVLPFNGIHASACKFISSKTNIAKLMAELLATASVESSPNEMAALWSNSGINFSSFFPSEEEAQQFIKNKKLESLVISSSPKPSTSTRHSSSIQEELRDLILKRKARNEEVFSWVDDNVRDTKDNQFIRAIVTAVCESCKMEDGDSCKCDKETLINRKIVLHKYIQSNSSLELQALYALQALAEQLDHPPGFLRSYFDSLYDEDIISEDSFYAWEKCEDPAEQKGKGAAKTSSVQFFKWLRSAEEEPAKDT